VSSPVDKPVVRRPVLPSVAADLVVTVGEMECSLARLRLALTSGWVDGEDLIHAKAVRSDADFLVQHLKELFDAHEGKP